MNIVVPESGRLRASTIHRATTTSSGSKRVVDLQYATFVEPAGLVAIAAAAERGVLDDCDVEIRGPRDGNCANYLSRMQVGAELSRLGIPHDLPSVRSNDVGDRLSELRRFESEDDLEDVARTIIELYGDAEPSVIQALYLALFEIGVNAVEHSGRRAGYVALQQFPRVRQVAFAIADSGIGIRAKLGSATDESAIRMAARKYATTEMTPGRGHGITSVIEQTGRHMGTVVMFSGTCHGSFANGSWDPRVTPASSPFLGTVVEARLAQDGRVDA